jgi:hypothetical protein
VNRKRLIVLAGSAVLAACGSSAPGSAATAHCGPFDAKTLAASSVARVYAMGNSVYGCSMDGSGAFLLGQRKTCIGAARVAPVVVARQFAAYGSTRCGIDTGSTQVVVRRLTDGKIVRTAVATSPPGVEAYQSIASLVLRSDGAVAWIGVGRSLVGHGSPKIEVYRANRRGKVQLLDSGPSVRPGSLTLNGSRLTWKNGTALRYGTLS